MIPLFYVAHDNYADTRAENYFMPTGAHAEGTENAIINVTNRGPVFPSNSLTAATFWLGYEGLSQ